MNPARDYRLEVTNRIVQLLEEGVAPWQKPWDAMPAPMPISVATGKPYRGGNALELIIKALQCGYGDPRWLTYKQAADRGWQVRRGEKGTFIEFWDFKPIARKTEGQASAEEGSGEASDEEQRRHFIHRVYVVFNGQQVDGIPPYPVIPRPEIAVIEAGERILAHSGAIIRHDQADRAFYRRTSDTIHLPKRDYFKSVPAYYGTALHELAHWTGHASRLARATLTDAYQFGDLNYAKEELRAELASLFLASERGIPHDPSQHAAYVASWIKALKDDKHEIFRAASDASAAADYLLQMERAPGLVLELPRHADRVREPKVAYGLCL